MLRDLGLPLAAPRLERRISAEPALRKGPICMTDACRAYAAIALWAAVGWHLAERTASGQFFGPVPVMNEVIHRTAEGRRMLVIHGHQFDGSLNPNRWFLRMGHQAYLTALRVDRWYSGDGRPRPEHDR